MLRGQRSQVRERGGQGAQWGHPEESPPGQDKADPSTRRGQSGGGLGGVGGVGELGLFYCILPPALGWRHSFPGETKGLPSWRPAPLGGRFAPRTQSPQEGRLATLAPGSAERGTSDHPMLTPV